MIKDTLYSEYIKRRSGREILENENGFIIYKITGDECFIVEMFISETHRGSKLFKSLLQTLSEIALIKKCQILSANIHLDDVSGMHSLRSALHFGFNIVRAENDILIIAKKLGV